MNANTQLASLIWQPGAHMDVGWWGALGMSAWQTAYARHPACRVHVDRLLVAQRGWPVSAQASDCVPIGSDAARAILRLASNLRRVSLAHGLRALGCPDYLLLGAYRRALSPWLDAWQCDRLLLTRREWPGVAAYTTEQIAVAALTATGACLDAALTALATSMTSIASTAPGLSRTLVGPTESDAISDDVATVHAAVRILLPPPNADVAMPGGVPDGDDIWPRLAALEKMLCMSSTVH